MFLDLFRIAWNKTTGDSAFLSELLSHPARSEFASQCTVVRSMQTTARASCRSASVRKNLRERTLPKRCSVTRRLAVTVEVGERVC